MELNKIKWEDSDIKQFQDYIKTFRNEKRIDWTRKIINTALPCLAVPTNKIKEIAKEIIKGDYISFLDLNIWEYYDNVAINGFVISNIFDFEVLVKYLLPYARKVDNWANCDLLSLNINKLGLEKVFQLVETMVKDENTFVRRIGFRIIFNYLKNDDYLHRIIQIIIEAKDEKEYYVNMIVAWLVCELFIKQRESAISLIKDGQLNDWVTNKAIQKCRDSFRVSSEDKENLLKYKK